MVSRCKSIYTLISIIYLLSNVDENLSFCATMSGNTAMIPFSEWSHATCNKTDLAGDLAFSISVKSEAPDSFKFLLCWEILGLDNSFIVIFQFHE